MKAPRNGHCRVKHAALAAVLLALGGCGMFGSGVSDFEKQRQSQEGAMGLLKENGAKFGGDVGKNIPICSPAFHRHYPGTSHGPSGNPQAEGGRLGRNLGRRPDGLQRTVRKTGPGR